MQLCIRRAWCSAIVVISIVAALGGFLVTAVQRVRVAAERLADT
jgi:hypothetical protein